VGKTLAFQLCSATCPKSVIEINDAVVLTGEGVRGEVIYTPITFVIKHQLNDRHKLQDLVGQMLLNHLVAFSNQFCLSKII
jgi:hypothetical protein